MGGLSPRPKKLKAVSPSIIDGIDKVAEIDAILKVVCLFAKKAGVRSPTMNRVLSLLTMKARAAGIYDG